MMTSTREKGANAEDVAVIYLKENGFMILHRNYRTRVGEIDIIAQKGCDIFFVEVKARFASTFGRAFEAVMQSKQRTIIRVARYYLLRLKKPVPCHLSAIAVLFDRYGVAGLSFIKDAFEVRPGF